MDFFQQIDNIALLEPAAHFELFRSISNALNSKKLLPVAYTQILLLFSPRWRYSTKLESS